jgi:aminoglycoside phosphotransferase (APT) family kinase protein
MTETSPPPPGPDEAPTTRSSRDPEQLRLGLERWLRGRWTDGSAPTVPELAATSTNGMSSETVLFEAVWEHDGRPRIEPLVARIAPDLDDVPVFPSYDLEKQYEVMRLVRELTAVPVPKLWWYEPDAGAIGAPFFVMSRVDGQVPPDVLPYNFGDSWLFASAPEEQRALQDSSVEVLVQLHRLDGADPRFAFLELPDPGATPLRRHVAHTRAWYEFAHDGHRSELIERGFRWLDEHWPDEGPPVVLWGDSRIGNTMYLEHRPVAVLDWEMAAVGPRELDVAWMTYAHAVFEGIAHTFGLPGMPDFLRPEDVAATYETGSGVALRDLDWYLAYAAVQYAIVFLRTGLRAVHFGEKEMPADVEELVMNAEPLARMIGE